MIVPDPPLLLVTDRAAARLPLSQVVAAALEGGCHWIMVREKLLSAHPRESGDPDASGSVRQPWIPAFAGMSGPRVAADLLAEQRLVLATETVGLARPYGAMVVVNGDVAAARAAGAHGVHLPRNQSVARAREALGAGAVIGVSAHDEAEAAAAEREGADYVTLSPVFASISKPGYGPGVGLEGLARIARRVSIPMVALGGIDAGNAALCLAAGARAVAVLGAVMAAPDPRTATARLVAALKAPT